MYSNSKGFNFGIGVNCVGWIDIGIGLKYLVLIIGFVKRFIICIWFFLFFY